MKRIFQNLKGDKFIWAIVGLLAIFSFIPVYSASSNLAYLQGDGSTFKYLLKHGAHLFLGFILLYVIHKVPYRFFRGLSIIMIPVVILLLLYTMAQGTTIDGANASRWINVGGLSFQTSTLASVVLMVYVARYLSKIHNKAITFKETLLPLWLPVFVILALILPANFSTTAIVFAMVVVLVFLGGYPLKYLGVILGIGLVMLTIFILSAKAFPGVFPNRVDTWISRVENFTSDDDTDAYQIEKAKTAIATGFPIGVGPGKSKQKNFLEIVVQMWNHSYGRIIHQGSYPSQGSHHPQ